MAIRFYDEAIAKKIESWLPTNNKIQILKPDETQRLFSVIADQNDDKPIQLPLIAISRETEIDLLKHTIQPMTFDGMMLESDGKHTLQLNAIPISITYQIDVYTKRYDEGDELLRELVFKIINNPQLTIELPYNNQKLTQVCAMKLQGQVSDTSSISERLFAGQFTRWTMRVDIDGANLYSIPNVENVHVGDVSVDVATNNEKAPRYQREKVK